MKLRSWRPRFSLKVLLLLPLLVGLVLMSAIMTRQHGEASVEKWLLQKNGAHGDVVYEAPLLISETKRDSTIVQNNLNGVIISEGEIRKHYYMWLFGATIKLPYSKQIPDPIIAELQKKGLIPKQ